MATAEESKLINQGSYGCIYYPSLPFQLSRDKHKAKKHHHHPPDEQQQQQEQRAKYVSKLQKHNFHSEFEDYIGKKIQEIPSFELFFVPILKTHKIDLATIKQSHVTDCDAISKYIKRNGEQGERGERGITSNDYTILNKKFIIQKMKYINGISLRRYISNIARSPSSIDAYTSKSDDTDDTDDAHADADADDPDEYVSKSLRKDERQLAKYRAQFKEDEQNATSFHLMSVVFDMYERIIDSIQILIKYKLVHYDLKENNILIEHKQQLPYIIDFGLSIDVARLLEHPWSDKQEESSSSSHTKIDSDVLYRTNSSKIFQHNYLWRQHFYVHAPDYFLWPIEVHLMTYLINEQDTLTDESLRKICYEYIRTNKAFAYMSREFKKKLFRLSVATFTRFVHQPREKVLNELLKYWTKWDMYAINIMFLKILYEMVFHVDQDDDQDQDQGDHQDQDQDQDQGDHQDQGDQRQKILDPHYSSDASIIFKNRFKIKLKQKYNNEKIMNTIQIMLRNIHPDPDKRMTPQETKTFFVSIFYEC
jgi:serine/threonine protein kinase